MLTRMLAVMTLILTLTNSARGESLDEGIAAYQRGDYPQAQELFLSLAGRGDARAQLYLGYLHFHGQGVAEDNGRALGYFAAAADQGDADAQYQLGYMYVFGFTPLAPASARQLGIQWSLRAATQGNADARVMLSHLLREEGLLPTRLALLQGDG